MQVRVNPVYTRSRLSRWRDALVYPTSVCCCIPVRIGFMIMTFLTILLACALSIVIWFEVFKSSNPLSETERKAFIGAGILESSLALAAITGFVGAVTRQYKSVLIYTYFIYIHFFLNIVIGIWFLVTIRQNNGAVLIEECNKLLNQSENENCYRIAAMSKVVFVVITGSILLLELYGVSIASGYRQHLRDQKADLKQQRLGYYHAMGAPVPPPKHLRNVSDQFDDVQLLQSYRSRDSSYVYEDPYEENSILDIRPLSAAEYQPVSTHMDPGDLSGSRVASSCAPETTSSSSLSSRRLRSLPPLPALSSGTGSDPLEPVRQTEWANDKARQLDGRLRPLPRGIQSYAHPPPNPPPPFDIDFDRPREEIGTSVSTHAHSALMDHAAVMQGVFRPVFIPTRDQTEQTSERDEPPPYRQMSQRAP